MVLVPTTMEYSDDEKKDAIMQHKDFKMRYHGALMPVKWPDTSKNLSPYILSCRRLLGFFPITKLSHNKTQSHKCIHSLSRIPVTAAPNMLFRSMQRCIFETEGFKWDLRGSQRAHPWSNQVVNLSCFKIHYHSSSSMLVNGHAIKLYWYSLCHACTRQSKLE